MLKKSSLLLICLFLASCAHQSQPVAEKPGQGIMPPPTTPNKELRAGEKMNMMLLMQVEDSAGEMDEVIVIPPKDKKAPTK